MKYAIISDIHGNLAALKQTLDQIDTLKCDRIICLGDIVGYGPYPNECCEIIQDRAHACVAGNHDHAALGIISTHHFNRFAKAALEWTIGEMNEKTREFLSSLPLLFEEEDMLFVHSSPIDPAQWNYVLSLYDAELSFKMFTNRACFIGHSHFPVAYSYEDGEFPKIEKLPRVKFFSGFRYIVNVGSVGQPRDEHRDACFGVYDSNEQIFELVRVPYNIEETQQAMARRNLPTFLIERLAFGR